MARYVHIYLVCVYLFYQDISNHLHVIFLLLASNCVKEITFWITLALKRFYRVFETEEEEKK